MNPGTEPEAENQSQNKTATVGTKEAESGPGSKTSEMITQI